MSLLSDAQKEDNNLKGNAFVCDMSGLTDLERDQHIAMIKKVFGAVTAIRELSDGYTFCLDAKERKIKQTAKFISKERLCCPFFRFELKVESDKPLQLSLRGSDGIKPFIKAEIGEALNRSIADRYNFTA